MFLDHIYRKAVLSSHKLLWYAEHSPKQNWSVRYTLKSHHRPPMSDTSMQTVISL